MAASQKVKDALSKHCVILDQKKKKNNNLKRNCEQLKKRQAKIFQSIER